MLIDRIEYQSSSVEVLAGLENFNFLCCRRFLVLKKGRSYFDASGRRGFLNVVGVFFEFLDLLRFLVVYLIRRGLHLKFDRGVRLNVFCLRLLDFRNSLLNKTFSFPLLRFYRAFHILKFCFRFSLHRTALHRSYSPFLISSNFEIANSARNFYKFFFRPYDSSSLAISSRLVVSLMRFMYLEVPVIFKIIEENFLGKLEDGLIYFRSAGRLRKSYRRMLAVF